MLKIGIDIHGVIDHDPVFFKWFTEHYFERAELHIISGGRVAHNEDKLRKWGIKYHKFFSITDKHIAIGTPRRDECPDGGVCIADHIWDREKGNYCSREGINLMIDDTFRYSIYMPRFTQFFHYS